MVCINVTGLTWGKTSRVRKGKGRNIYRVWRLDTISSSSSKKTLHILAIFLLGKCGVLHIKLKNMYHGSDIKPMLKHSEAEKSVKSILFGNMHYFLERTDKNTSTCTTNQR